MSILNRATLKQKVSDFINRVEPFTDPLIQKTEDNEIRDDFADSLIFKQSTVGSVNNPGATFSLNFVTNDEFNVNTTASIPSDFVITLSNLENNSTGKINITKKTTQKFTFGNGVILRAVDDRAQDGKTFIAFLIYKTGSSFFAMPMYEPTANGDIEGTFPTLNIGVGKVTDSKLSTAVKNSFVQNAGNTASFTKIKTKIVNIPAWDMNTTPAINVPHGLSDHTAIRSIDAIVRNNDGSTLSSLFSQIGTAFDATPAGGSGGIDSTNIVLNRMDNQTFATISTFSGTANTRGWIKITYEET